MRHCGIMPFSNCSGLPAAADQVSEGKARHIRPRSAKPVSSAIASIEWRPCSINSLGDDAEAGEFGDDAQAAESTPAALSKFLRPSP
jgi:hypothetical protein